MKKTKFIAFRANKEIRFKLGVLQYEDAIRKGEAELSDVINYISKRIVYKLK